MTPNNDNHLTGNKLLILFIIQQKESISGIELTEFVGYNEYMDYFTLQQYLDELSESKLIIMDDAGYHLTETGAEVINTFRSRIPHSMREQISEYAKTSKLSRSSMLELDVRVTPGENGHYTVECIVRDYDQTPFVFNIQADTEADAYVIRNNWLQKGMSIYRNLLSELRS